MFSRPMNHDEFLAELSGRQSTVAVGGRGHG